MPKFSPSRLFGDKAWRLDHFRELISGGSSSLGLRGMPTPGSTRLSTTGRSRPQVIGHSDPTEQLGGPFWGAPGGGTVGRASEVDVRTKS